MRKVFYLILFGISMVLTSCSHDVDYDYGKYETDKYNSAFIKTFGEPASNQTWGFGKSTATTRSAYTNSNMWESDGYTIPQNITQDEINRVLEVFNIKGKETYTALVDWDCFFVQQVWKGTASYTAGNGGTVVGGNQMDWLCAYDPVGKEETIYPDWNNWQATVITSHDDHVNNFNNANGSIMLMVNSSTNRFGYKSSTDNGHVFYYFRMEKINGAYYVGFDFSAEGQNPNEQVQRDLIYNDWIVKIVPGYGSNPPSNKLRIMAEDLSASEGTDFDFNDVVIDVDIENGNAYCSLLAAGGTLPLRIAGSDNLEVHSLFGVPVNEMVNTKAGHHQDYAAVPFVLNGITDAQNIKLEVNKNGQWLEMTARQGQPAAKIAVPQSVDWCNERQGINFGGWVQDVNYIWW